ncbi:MAG TPA: GAK system CofD-like protein [Polyangiaceae bacterium]|nr:GAK system CofD-like protein [Polyangiaceae bacterium]
MSAPPRLPRDVRLLPEPPAACKSEAPELGPRILFFSGGTALRPLSRALKLLTHNSIHLITTFDSGGSSALLRRAFGMPALGDLRNRVVALADETVRGNPQIYRLFSHRLPRREPSALRAELDALASGEHALVRELVEPMLQIVEAHLGFFIDRMPTDFDLRGANVGNLLLAGGYLQGDRDLESVLSFFSRLLEVRGLVRPVVPDDLHLGALLADGSSVVGQHRLTGKEAAPIAASVQQLGLVRSLDDPTPAAARIGDEVRRHVEAADLICYPMGSFYSSVIANLLPGGVGRAITRAACPRVYVPNTGADPEQRGMTVASSVEALLRYVRDDAGADVPPSQVVNLVLLDRNEGNYALPVDVRALERMGVQVMSLTLVTEPSRSHIDPQRLAEALMSLSRPAAPGQGLASVKDQHG